MLEVVIVMGFVSARLTRLVYEDTIFDGPRNWLLGWVPNKVAELLTCPWCISAYTTAATVIGFDLFVSVPLPFAAWLAAWWVACFAYWAGAAVSKYADEKKKPTLPEADEA